jgi:hypothetical protein
MVVELLLVTALFPTLLAIYGGRGMRLIVLLSTVVSVLYIGQLLFVQEQLAVSVGPYVSRYSSIVQEASGRLEGMTVGSFHSVIAHNGWFGAGAGTATQGAAQFGGGVKLVGYAAEGGIAKVLAELGIHGLLVGLWVVAAFGHACHMSLRAVQDPAYWRWSLLATGLVALLMSNVMVFATAAQVFGDPFVLLVLGLSLGLVLRAREQRG